MNKNRCKNIIKKAIENLEKQEKELNEINLENEIRAINKKEIDLYIKYGRLSINFLESSANNINCEEVLKELEVIFLLYGD